MRHDPERTGEEQQNARAEGKRHDIVDVVWAGRVMWKKKTRSTIWAIARTISGRQECWARTSVVPEMKKDITVSRVAERQSNQIALSPSAISAASRRWTQRDICVMAVGLVGPVSAHCAAQIYHREYRNPMMQGVPEQAEAENAPEVHPVSLSEHLRHHRQQPEQADGDMKAMASDQRKKGREERAPRRPSPRAIMPWNSRNLDGKKGGSKDEVHGHRAI